MDESKFLDFLKLNDSKTEFMVLGSKVQIEKVDIEHIRVGNSYIVQATSGCTLGVMIDSNLTLDCHVTAMSKAAFCSIRKIGKICKHLTRDAAETIIHAFVTSKLDSNNSLLYVITNTQLAQLQRLQNTVARIITYTKRTCRSHISCACRSTLVTVEQRLYTSCASLFIKLCMIRYQNILLTLLKYMFRDIVGYTPQYKNFYSSLSSRLCLVIKLIGLCLAPFAESLAPPVKGSLCSPFASGGLSCRILRLRCSFWVSIA